MNRLGMICGRRNDYAKAREWYAKAIERGDTSAMINMGVLYVNGDGVAKDYNKAAEWYTKAAEKGVVRGMTNLGDMYERGRQGFARDYAKTREWYAKAAAKGDEESGKKVKEMDMNIAHSNAYNKPNRLAGSKWAVADRGIDEEAEVEYIDENGYEFINNSQVKYCYYSWNDWSKKSSCECEIMYYSFDENTGTIRIKKDRTMETQVTIFTKILN